MKRRVPRISGPFPVVLCEREIGGVAKASIGQYQLPTTVSDPDTFLVIGDTGCRIVHYKDPQKCNYVDDTGWPFANIAFNAANHATNSNTIIIHLGDYHYREAGCLDTERACSGSPFGDNWATWKTEFFKPAKPLLTAAPWVMMRGNHEACERAGVGYLFFFGLQDFDGACEDNLPPYRIPIGRTRVLRVFDTASAKSPYKQEERCKKYQEWMEGLSRDKETVWLGIHQPLWLYSTDKKGNPQETASPVSNCDKRADDERKPADLKPDARVDNEDPEKTGGSEPKAESKADITSFHVIRTGLDASPSGGHKHSVRLVLSGDAHMFQFFQPKQSGVPVQIVAGNGGTALDELYPQEKVDNARSKSIKSASMSFGVEGKVSAVARHGFLLLRRNESIWNGTLYSSRDAEIVTCRFSETGNISTEDSCSDIKDP
jgi:hypothetical protein